MIDLGRAYEILTEAFFTLDPEEPERSLVDIAKLLSLEIVLINFERGAYHGHVLGVSKSQCLINHSTGRAFILDLTEIPDGQPLPRPGDTITVQALNHIVTTSLRVSEANQRADRAAAAKLPDHLRDTFI